MRRNGGSYGLIFTDKDHDELDVIDNDTTLIPYSSPLWETNSFLKQVKECSYKDNDGYHFKIDKIYQLSLLTEDYGIIGVNALNSYREVLHFNMEDGDVLSLAHNIVDEETCLEIDYNVY